MDKEVSTWKEQTEALFFIEHLKIKDIATIVNKSRKTISEFLNGHEKYKAEMLWRKEQSKHQRKDYQKQWDRDNRSSSNNADYDKEMLKQCHYEAVRVLSHEKY